MRILSAVVITFILLVALGGLYLYSGAYIVAADVSHTAFGKWLFSTAMEKSVQRRAHDISVPDLSQMDWVEDGFSHYTGNCAGCHGAPGVERSEVGKALTPEPPKLAEASGEWTPGELFWIIKHGIKMTGMPAWGGSHSDEQIWQLVAFIQKLPTLDAQEYRRMEEQVGGAHGGDSHGGHAH